MALYDRRDTGQGLLRVDHAGFDHPVAETLSPDLNARLD
jgi:hypothetical protein